MQHTFGPAPHECVLFFVGGLWRSHQYFNATTAQILSSTLLLVVVGIMIPSASQFLIKKGSSGVLVQSRGSCILLLVSYGFWLFYQLHTHSKFYNEESRKIPVDIVPKGDKRGGDNEDSEAPSPQLTLSVIALVLGIFVTLLTFNTRFTADSIDSLLDDAGLMPSFIGLIIMPMLNNDPTILVAAAKNKMDLSIAFMLGKVYSNCSGRGPNHHSSCMGYES